MTAEELVVSVLAGHRWIGWLDNRSKCSCGHKATSILTMEAHVALAILSALGIEQVGWCAGSGSEELMPLEWTRVLIPTDVPVYRLKGLED